MNIIQYLKESNRYKHLLLGFICGMLSNSWYATIYCGLGVSGALEFKDYQWGGNPDWVDFLLTFAGFCLGYLLISMVI